MAKGKGKGKGKGRGRPKESDTSQQERTVERASIQNGSNLPESDQCPTNGGKAEQLQSCDSKSRQLKGSNFGDRVSSGAEVPDCDTQRASNASVAGPSREEKRKVDESLNGDFGSLSLTKNPQYKKNIAPDSDKQKDLPNVSGNHKLYEESCNNGVGALQTDNALHNQTKTSNTNVSLRENKDALCSPSNSHQNSETESPRNVKERSLSVLSSLVEFPSAAKTDIIRRPNFGSQGRLIPVIANYFLLKGKSNDIYHYDVEIVDKSRKKTSVKNGPTQPRKVGKERCREIINQLINDKCLKGFYPFYDGNRNLYTLKEIGAVREKRSVDITLFEVGKTKTYTVTIQPVKKNGGGRNVIDMESLNRVYKGGDTNSAQEAIMAFDMLLCHRDPPFKQVSIGRSFFSFSEMRKDRLDGQVELWKGYNQSVHLTQRGPAVVVNLANKAFHSAGFVIEYACDLLGFDITRQRIGYDHIQTLSKNLSKVKVEVTHLPYPRKYTVSSVTKASANNLPVNINGREISVAQFFSQKYKPLKFPDLPCLAMRSTGKPTYTPMEFCMIVPGQAVIGKLNGRQTSDMIRRTAVPPTERFEDIMNYAKSIVETSGAYINQAGLKMQLEPIGLMARVISAPALTYKNQTPVQPDPRGVWRIDGQNFTAVVPGQINWCLISFAEPYRCSTEMLQRLSSAISGASRSVGLKLNPPLTIRTCDQRTSTCDILGEAKRHKVNFAFLVLSRSDRVHSYDEVKFIADVKLGLVTQCMEDVVVPKTIEGQGSAQILNNILSKLNIKLGGVNHTISRQTSVSMKGTIVMGADAAHSPRGSKCPSIAAVVGSVDHVPFQYAVTCKVQKNPDETKLSQEIILDMKEMTKHVLRSYMNNNRGVVPQRIIFFRDGVSEGQFEIVLEKELRLIQLACCEMFKKKLPVTFIVVQKRHQTRFIPRYPKDAVGRGGNVPPGTTVDTDVVHPVYFDFFICSHEGLKGTSKPAHYVVLHDDNKFKADELQKFCYELCHVYARCNRSISIPAPAMNAHLAAARAKKYVDWHISRDTGSSTGNSSDETYCLPQQVIDFVNNISTIKTPMFFV